MPFHTTGSPSNSIFAFNDDGGSTVRNTSLPAAAAVSSASSSNGSGKRGLYSTSGDGQHSRALSPTSSMSSETEMDPLNTKAPTNSLSKRLNCWNERYNELVQFKRLQGHCNVPSCYEDNPALSQWVKRQRYQHKLKSSGKHSNLTTEREGMLDSLGFIWNAHEANWEESYTKLMKFKEYYGHCRVPTKYPSDQQLAVWVKLQRRQYRLLRTVGADKSNMTWERVDRLNDIGFEWDPRKLDR